jgi:hypothetical protein
MAALLRSGVQTRGDFNADISIRSSSCATYYLDGKATEPGNSALLSGSANFTWTGTHVNLNNVFVVHNSFVCRR